MIEVNHLTKKYGDHTAVSDLSFTIEKGQIYGFLGPNGAGKSTTMNIMTGCLAATEGEVKIGGYDIFEEPEAAKKLIGYLPEIPPLYIDQTPREYLTFVAEAKGIRGKAALAAAIDEVVEETHIEDVQYKLIRHLSKGYRQRVGIAQALLGNPEVIILDEPTVGLDPIQIIEIRELIQKLGEKHTVILSSHILPEVQAICQKVLIIYKGKLVAFDEPENLQRTLSGDSTIELTVEAPMAAFEGVAIQIPQINKVEKTADGVNKDKATGSLPRISATLHVAADEIDEVCRRLFFAFAELGYPILQMTPVKASLEDIFLELTGGNGTPENEKKADKPKGWLARLNAEEEEEDEDKEEEA